MSLEGSVSEADAFDYVIVGAGSAGCVLANRLSADLSVRVALVEAGPRDSHPFIHVPAAVAAAIGTPSLGWGYWTAPQAHMDGRRIPIPRGRVLGGSSAINGMVYNRGHPSDYDDWAALGNVGWSYREVLPYFVRSEDNESLGHLPHHGKGGEMAVTDIRHPNRLNFAFLEAMQQLQIRPTPDFTGHDPEGFGLRQGNIKGGRRESMATAFLRPAERRSNLTVVTNALCRRMVIEGKRATGVEVIQNGASRVLAARREVVVSGGAIGSPQILLLSGIGDGAALQKLGIEVKHHLPAVGANLQDHLAVLVQMVTDNDATSYGISVKAAPRGAWNLLEYALFRRGPLSSNLFESTAFLRTTPELKRPDIQYVFQPARRNQNTFPIPIGHGFVMSSVLLYPKSRGTITLASPDPSAAPVIDPNLLSEPEDYEPLLRAIAFSRRAFATQPFVKYGAREFLPGKDVQDPEALKAYIRRTGVTVHHPAGTCRMGSDPDSVLDPQLRVRGIEGLRVADASIFPILVGGNTNAPVVMVAEKASDMILGKAPLKPMELEAAA
jgi:choline dehydrogenase-like flavoprotein